MWSIFSTKTNINNNFGINIIKKQNYLLLLYTDNEFKYTAVMNVRFIFTQRPCIASYSAL